MRIAHCVHGLGLGGAQKVIGLIAEGCDRRDFRFFIYSSEDGVLRPDVERSGATVRVLRRRVPKFDPLWLARLARAMRRDRIDLVHTHLFGDSLHGYLAARAAGRLPVIMTLHCQNQGLTALQRAGYRWLLPRCSRAVACSRAVLASFVEHGGAGAGRIVAIPNGIRCTALDPGGGGLRSELGLDAGALVIAAIGRQVGRKGFDALIRAFARLERDGAPGATLLFLGDGPLRDELRRLAAEQGVAARVVFAGYRPDVPTLLGAVDVVAFSSRFEGLPMALLEAMAAGRCIVATGLPGILEAVRDGREAAIAAPDDPEEGLYRALRRVCADPGLRARLGAEARRRFLERFTAETMVRGYETLYRETLADRGRAA